VNRRTLIAGLEPAAVVRLARVTPAMTWSAVNPFGYPEDPVQLWRRFRDAELFLPTPAGLLERLGIERWPT
jgi:hypothetical protein